jgi:hypothetical protein
MLCILERYAGLLELIPIFLQTISITITQKKRTLQVEILFRFFTVGVNTETVHSYDMVKHGMINLDFFFFAESADRFPVPTGSRAGRFAAGSA